MVKRFVSFLFFLMILSLFGLLIVPNFIDWNRHKDKIITLLAERTDAEIAIDGEVYFKVLPQPHMVLGAVSIDKGVMTAEKLAARVKLAPLLEGDIEFDSLSLIKPALHLVVDRSGNRNWEGIVSGSAAPAPVIGGTNIRLNHVTIEDAQLTYTNHQNGVRAELSKISLDIHAETLYGPYSIMGNASYAGKELVVDIKSKKYDGKTPVSFTSSFKPISDTTVPSIKLNGVVDLKPEFGIQGQLTLQEGRLASLFTDKQLEAITFLKEPASLSTLLEIKKDKISLNNLSLKAAKEAGANGKGEIAFGKNHLPKLSLELDGNNLVITHRTLPEYVAPPKGFTGEIRFKGRNTVIAGENIGFLNTRLAFDAKKWGVKSSSAYLRGKGKIDFSGEIDPAIHTANYKAKITVEDLKAFVDNLPLGQHHVLHALANSPDTQSLEFDGNISISPKQVSFYNMKTSLGKLGAVEGVVNIDRTLNAANATARITTQHLNLSGMDRGLAKTLASGVMDVELTAGKVSHEGTELADLRVQLMAKEGNIQIHSLSAALNGNPFTVTGTLQSLYPVSAADIRYNFSSGSLREIAKLFGVEDPPVLFSTVSQGIQGSIKGGDGVYAFEAQSKNAENELNVQGTRTAGLYDATIQILAKDTHSVLKEMSLPLDSVANYEGRLQFSGKLQGAASNYSIENIDAKIGKRQLTGRMEKKDGKHTAHIELSEVDIDKALSSHLKVENNFVLTLSGASSWGGKVTATLSAEGLKGRIAGVDLNHVARILGWEQTLEFAAGDMDFTLKTGAKGVQGDVLITSPLMRFKGFSYATLGEALNALTSVPVNLGDIVRAELAKGDLEFKDITLPVTVKEDGSAVLKPGVEFKHASGTLRIREARGNVKDKSYYVAAGLEILQPKSIPAFEIRKSSGSAGYHFDMTALEKFVTRNNPPPVPVQPSVEALPAASEALPPVASDTVPSTPAGTENKANPIDRILDNLEEDEMLGAETPAE